VRLTLERIADLAGVSRSTASRVINGQDGVRPEVRRRVLDVIEATGYVPHAAARSLAGQRSRILGLAIRNTTEQVFADPYFAALTQGVSKACNDHDQTLSLFLFQSEGEREQLPARVLRTKLIDGLIVTATFSDDPLLWQLADSGIPFVVVGEVSSPDIPTVDADNQGGARMAAEHLLAIGRRRISTITGPMRSGAAAARRVAFERALASAGHPLDPRLVVESDFTEEGAYAAMQALLPQEPDAVFAFSDRMALGVVRALQDAGRSVPEDVAVVGFDDLPPARASTPPLTTIRQEVEQTGMRAVELLLERIESPDAPARRIELPTRLVVRSSTSVSDRVGTTGCSDLHDHIEPSAAAWERSQKEEEDDDDDGARGPLRQLRPGLAALHRRNRAPDLATSRRLIRRYRHRGEERRRSNWTSRGLGPWRERSQPDNNVTPMTVSSTRPDVPTGGLARATVSPGSNDVGRSPHEEEEQSCEASSSSPLWRL